MMWATDSAVCVTAMPLNIPTVMQMMLTGIITSNGPKKGIKISKRKICINIPDTPPASIPGNMFQSCGTHRVTPYATVHPDINPMQRSMNL